jgi:hypothetical protein
MLTPGPTKLRSQLRFRAAFGISEWSHSVQCLNHTKSILLHRPNEDSMNAMDNRLERAAIVAVFMNRPIAGWSTGLETLSMCPHASAGTVS